ncbi:hypothetical protein BSL78_08732 [Apostichopus japonicus]|uniref:Uncharacterized protein n=1 Tax=Stichopus japonicus TaxID=307972 RepID=A0A2G8L273_STIJA|nr:hypothetical protein BSL78_08732 [Apostichopus japonicus]
MSRNPLKCINAHVSPRQSLGRTRPLSKCRSCTRRDPCLVCIKFTPAQWQDIDLWLEGLRSKLQGRLDSIPSAIGAPEVPGITGDREEEGVVRERWRRWPGEGRRRERGRERGKRKRKNSPNGPGYVRISYGQREGQEQRQGSCQEKTSKAEAQLGRAGDSVSVRAAAKQTHRARPSGRGRLGSKERATEGAETEPVPFQGAGGGRERRVPTEIPRSGRESRGESPPADPEGEIGVAYKIPKTEERKRYSPISDESSDSSDDGYRRSKRRRRSPRRRQEEEPAWLPNSPACYGPCWSKGRPR